MRIDYGKLRHLLTVDHHLNGSFSQLRSIIENGEIASEIVSSFPLEELTEPENFVSQLLFFGLLTFVGEQEGDALLRIPNRTIQNLLYGYLRDGFKDVDVFRLNLKLLSDLLRGMAYRGEWQAFFAYVTASVKEQASIGDYLSAEKMLKVISLQEFGLVGPGDIVRFIPTNSCGASCCAGRVSSGWICSTGRIA